MVCLRKLLVRTGVFSRCRAAYLAFQDVKTVCQTERTTPELDDKKVQHVNSFVFVLAVPLQ